MRIGAGNYTQLGSIDAEFALICESGQQVRTQKIRFMHTAAAQHAIAASPVTAFVGSDFYGFRLHLPGNIAKPNSRACLPDSSNGFNVAQFVGLSINSRETVYTF